MLSNPFPGEIHSAIKNVQHLSQDSLNNNTLNSALQNAKTRQDMHTIFASFTDDSLSQEEKTTVDRLYRNISSIPCRLCPSLVEDIAAYRTHRILSSSKLGIYSQPNFSSSPSAPESDPVLQRWQKEPHNSSKYQAYLKIMTYVQEMRQIHDLDLPDQEMPMLDLSRLGLTELPVCLLQDPIFAKANIFGNRCAQYPENLTVGSIRNIELYQEMQKQIQHSNIVKSDLIKSNVVNNPDLAGYILSFLDGQDLNTASQINAAFAKGHQLSSIDRLREIQKCYGHLLSADLQDRLKKALEVNVLSEHSEEQPKIWTTPEDRAQLEKDIYFFEKEAEKALHWLQQLPECCIGFTHYFPHTSALLQGHNISTLSPVEAIQLKKHFEAIQLKKHLISHAEKRGLQQAWPRILSQMSQTTQALWAEYIHQYPSAETDADLILSFMKQNQDACAHIEKLDLSDTALESIPAGIMYFKNLQTLDLHKNSFLDISSLTRLKNLQSLNIGISKVVDYSPLMHLEQLKELIMFGNDIKDMTPLASLTQLQILDINGTQIRDISMLSGLKNLQYLHIDYLHVVDCSPLIHLKQLRYLSMSHNNITDISVLSGLTQLEQLHMYGNKINDLSSVAYLFKLQKLWISNNQITDLSPLRDLANLGWLSADDNQIADVSPIQHLNRLHILSLYGNPITDISPLKSLPECRTIYLSKSQNIDPAVVEQIRAKIFLC